MASLGINMICGRALCGVQDHQAVHECVFTGTRETIDCDALISVTARQAINTLQDLLHQSDTEQTLSVIGDSLAPGTVAAAVYSGHLGARRLISNEDEKLFRRELIALPVE